MVFDLDQRDLSVNESENPHIIIRRKLDSSTDINRTNETSCTTTVEAGDIPVLESNAGRLTDTHYNVQGYNGSFFMRKTVQIFTTGSA